MNAQNSSLIPNCQVANDALEAFQVSFFEELKAILGEKPSAEAIEQNQYLVHGGAWLST